MASYSVVKFDRGMNNWIHPSLLKNDTASLLVNAEVDDGKVSPLKRPLALSIHDPVSYGHFGTRNRSLIKWYDRFYWSNNTAMETPFYGGNVENYLGIPFPFYSGENANVTIANVATETGETGLDGIYRYCICFVNPNGWEGAPGSLEEYELSGSLANEWAKITVTWEDERISYAKVYRTGNRGADFFAVGEIHSSGGVLIDKKDDLTLTMLNPLTSIDHYPPPDRGKFLCECGGVFFLAVGSRLYFSKQGNPHAWPTLNFIAIDDTISGIVPEFQGILVFTRNSAYRVIGAENPATVTKIYLPGNHGCVNFRSISSVNNAPIWLSNDGICLWDGNTITVPSYQVLHTDFLQVKYAVSARDTYYLFLAEGGIVFDRKNGNIFYLIDFSCEYAWYDGEVDVLYLQMDDQLYQYGAGNYLTYTYVSADIGASELTMKIFKEILVSCDGPSQLTASLEGKELFSVPLKSGRSRLKVPLFGIGRYISIKIKSNGRLKEVAVIYE